MSGTLGFNSVLPPLSEMNRSTKPSSGACQNIGACRQ